MRSLTRKARLKQRGSCVARVARYCAWDCRSPDGFAVAATRQYLRSGKRDAVLTRCDGGRGDRLVGAHARADVFCLCSGSLAEQKMGLVDRDVGLGTDDSLPDQRLAQGRFGGCAIRADCSSHHALLSAFSYGQTGLSSRIDQVGCR